MVFGEELTGLRLSNPTMSVEGVLIVIADLRRKTCRPSKQNLQQSAAQNTYFSVNNCSIKSLLTVSLNVI